MKPRWVRSAPDAITDRIHAVIPTQATRPAPAPVTRPSRPHATRPRTLRLPALTALAAATARPQRPTSSSRGITDRRVALAAGVLESLLDKRTSLAVASQRLGQVALPSHVIVQALCAALSDLSDAHERATLHAATECTDCVPGGYTCAWHHARLRSWWNARDAAAEHLVTTLRTAARGQR